MPLILLLEDSFGTLQRSLESIFVNSLCVCDGMRVSYRDRKSCTWTQSCVAALALCLLAPTAGPWRRGQRPSEALPDSTTAWVRAGCPDAPGTPLTQIWRVIIATTIGPTYKDCDHRDSCCNSCYTHRYQYLQKQPYQLWQNFSSYPTCLFQLNSF